MNHPTRGTAEAQMESPAARLRAPPESARQRLESKSQPPDSLSQQKPPCDSKDSRIALEHESESQHDLPPGSASATDGLMVQPIPSFAAESRALAQGFAPVAGVDEAGRGPLAGPVVAAAVILDPAAIPEGLADSKVLDEDRRESLYADIMAAARAVAVGSACPSRIDTTDIRKATLHAMSAAVTALALPARHVLVDGRDVPPLPLGVTGEAIVDGDALVVSIAAASIVAKVHRDRLMRQVHTVHPVYGFAVHKGYGTKAHRTAIEVHGPSPHHRMTFGLLKTMRAKA